MTSVAVLGLGTMGGRVAAALHAAGHRVRGWDPVQAAREAAADAGIAVAEDADGCVADAEVIVLSVPLPEHVREAAAGPLATRPGAVVADMSTVDPATSRAAAALLADADVAYVDVPVLGRPAGIGSWTLPAGGSPGAVERVRAVLEGPVARQVLTVGPVGAGQTVKLMNNLMFAAINAVTAELAELSRLAGVDPSTTVATIADSGAATVSRLFLDIGPRMLVDDHEPAFALGLLAKDNRLAAGLARDVGAWTPVLDTMLTLHADALEADLERLDTSAIHRLYREHHGGVDG